MHKIYNYKIEIGRHSHEVNRPKKNTHTHALNPSTKKKLKKTAKKREMRRKLLMT
jgi:hypothetical protein